MTNLEKAKEFEANLISYRSQLEISELNNWHEETLRIENKIIELIKQAKALKAKFEAEGCGFKAEYIRLPNKTKVRLICDGKGLIRFCPDCQAVLKVLEEVLG